MGSLMRSLDWSQTLLGSASTWAQSLKTAVSIILNSHYPMFIWWGREYANLYNDAYRPILGASKHPQFLGQSAKVCWAEIWDVVGPLADSVLNTGQPTWSENLQLLMDRYGYLEETYFTFSYSPIRDETGGVGGVFCAVIETTEKVIGERRLRTLRELAANTAPAKTVAAAYSIVAETLAQNLADIPFALLYQVEGSGKQAHLVGTSGIVAGTSVTPEQVDLTQDNDPWQLAQVKQIKEARIIEHLPEGIGINSASSALVIPIAQSGKPELATIVVLGINQQRAFDDEYQGFFDLVINNIATAIANADAYAAECQRAEALAELDRAKTTFFSNITHEFRTPLALMLGPLEEALAHPQGPLPSDRHKLEIAHRNSLRLLKLVNTLLDFSRIEAGRIQAHYQPTDLASFTADLAGVFRSAIEQAGIRYLVNCPPLPEAIYVDHQMWEKIVLNLLSNAFKFTFTGEICLDLRYCQDHIELEVRDTGTGIPAAELPRIFERFHRVPAAKGRTFEGSGIGLALVQELVKLHQGIITVSSIVDQGTSFIVSIPTGYEHLPSDRTSNIATTSTSSTIQASTTYIAEALRWLPQEGNREKGTLRQAQCIAGNREKSNLSPITSHLSPSSARILLVDDNADMRDYVQRLLSLRYEVATAADGVAALESIRQKKPDILITDIMMPKLDGFGLLQALRANPDTRTLPIILLSARAEEESCIAGLTNGADDYLIKPFSAKELLARVEANLKMAQIRQEVANYEQRLRLEAESANRVKDEFLAILSHELRSPLNPILGWSRLLQTHKLNPSKTAEALATIERNAKLQTQLIDDLLDVSRILRGKLNLNVAPVDLLFIIESAMETMQTAAVAKSIVIQTNLEQVGQVAGDSARLQQIVWNLLSNAIKFTPENGRVSIDLQQVGKYAQITVSDTGKGIEPEFLPFVFDYFRQADASITRKFGGLGLGLAIVRHLVELHGGTVNAASLGEGLGATFTVMLPLLPVQSQKLQENKSSHLELDLTGVRVLVVEDDLDSREFLVFVLEQYGAKVMAAENAAACFEILPEFQPDVLISDIGMPVEDGYSLIRRIRKLPASQGGKISAIALTAYAKTEDSQQALAAGFQTHLPKPIEPTLLAKAIINLLG
ncbi:response regulator [Nostoc spongiaeforme FACHB-130]|uniref:histidine kinase n=1 Tax=Nostoc spongiaeforme FACHB-130 TaxID=1357510 RepID=A0ABR8G2U5_9NOSO|nr:ATP-binding protein [Nostoc spongiaeforme]MBD2597522.1 response regulator [Nostoc spongiaeforme FACHB-130]